MESEDFQGIPKSGDATKFMEILMDNDKFQVHIKEIDTALNNNSNPTELTNILDDDINCKNDEHADAGLSDRNSGGPILKGMLDQGPNTKALSCIGPMTNNPSTRTWKRITTGPKTSFSNTEETHAGSKRETQDHEQIKIDTIQKKKKTDIEVVEISRLMAMEFTGTTVAALQHR